MDITAQAARRLLNWRTKNQRVYPWRQTADPYRVLIAEIMLQRTKSDQVAGLYSRFLHKYPNPSALVRADVRDVEEFLLPLGLKWRARKIWQLGKAITETFSGAVPTEREELLALPGVGDYVAAAVLCFAYGRDVPIIDANVSRVVGRLFNIETSGEARRDKKLIEKAHLVHRHVPSGKSKEFNWALLDFSATRCMQTNPSCPICPLNAICQYQAKTSR